MGTADDRRTERLRREALGAAGPRRRPDANSPAGRYAGRVYDGGHRPTAYPCVVLTRPLRPDGTGAEGAAVGLNAIEAAGVTVTVLDRLPAVGDVLKCVRIGGRWVARRRSGATNCPADGLLIVTLDVACGAWTIEALDAGTGAVVATKSGAGALGGEVIAYLPVPPGTYKARATTTPPSPYGYAATPCTVTGTATATVADGCSVAKLALKLCCPGIVCVQVLLCQYPAFFDAPCNGIDPGSLGGLAGTAVELVGYGSGSTDAAGRVCFPVPGGEEKVPATWTVVVARAKFLAKSATISNNCCTSGIVLFLDPVPERVCTCCCDIPQPRVLFLTDDHGGCTLAYDPAIDGWWGCYTYAEPEAATRFDVFWFDGAHQRVSTCCKKTGGAVTVSYLLRCGKAADGYGVVRRYWFLNCSYPACVIDSPASIPICSPDMFRNPARPAAGGGTCDAAKFGAPIGFTPAPLECGGPVNLAFDRTTFGSGPFNTIPTEAPRHAGVIE